MDKFAGVTGRDYYPNYQNFAVADEIIPEAGDQQVVSATTEAVMPAANSKSIWGWLGIIAALALLMHLKV